MLSLIKNIQLFLPAFVLIFLRLTAMFISMPIFGYYTLNPRLRVLLAFCFTLILFPSIGKHSIIFNSTGSLVLAGVQEVFLGLLIGFGTRLVFESFNMAGVIMAQQMGYSMANILDPTSGEQQPTVSQFWFLLLLVFFLTMNAHFFLIEVMIKNFQLLPLNVTKVQTAAGEQLMRGGTLTFELSLKIAAPVFMLLLVLDAAIALIARVMPQMNVFFVTLPLKIGVGLLAIVSSLNVFQSLFAIFFDEVRRFVEGLLIRLT